jgi:uncharacterized SAM-binding protein YcdF (DUF218 family)
MPDTSRRFRRTAKLLAVVVALSIPSVGWADPVQQFGLEELPSTPDGIIVLGGGLATYLATEKLGRTTHGPGERIAAAIRLAKRFPSARLLYSGEEPPPGVLPPLVRAGVPPAQIVPETKSRNTAENATFSAELIRPQPHQTWILVTSAYHMRRALACFRRAGFNVVPYAVETTRPRTEHLAREQLGALLYSLLGKCRALPPRSAS